MKPTDEFRTPEWLGRAMLRAADVPVFHTDPFCSRGFSGIPARRRITAEQDAFKVDFSDATSIGFNVPFSIPRRALSRIVEMSNGPTIGIVRSDTSCAWWVDLVGGHFPSVAFFHRVRFMTVKGEITEGSPRYGIAVVARNIDHRTFRLAMESARDPFAEERRAWVP